MRRGRAKRSKARGRSWLAALAALVILPAATAGAADLGFEGVRVGFSGAARDNLFKLGAWTPVWIQIRGGPARFDGTLEVEVPDDDGIPTIVRQPVDVPAAELTRIVAYTRPGSGNVEVSLRLIDDRGRVAARARSSTLGVTTDPVLPEEPLLIAMGQPQGLELIERLPGFNAERKRGLSSVTLARVDPTLGPAPGRWYGYDGALAVVLDTNDRALMDELKLRGQALVDWVARGGHLVVAVGGNWQAVLDSVLGPVLPAVLAGQERLSTLEGLDTFAGSTSNPITPAGSPPSLVTKLEQIESRGGKTLAAVGPVPLVVRGAHGFGRVTLVAVDVDQKPFSEWKDRPLFWVRALDLHRPAVGESAETLQMGGGRLYQTSAGDLASLLRQGLEQFPGVRLVPFGWVAFCVFVYILLIGPGDYLFLKKVVKRMELTWLTFPLIVVSVSLAAYVAAYALKGRELRVNKVDVLDVDQSAGTSGPVVSRGTTFVNLFSPQNRDYDVSIVPREIAPESPGADPAGGEDPKTLAPGTEMLLSWMGVPESGFGGMSGGGQVGFTAGAYSYQPPGRHERLKGLRVPIWSTKMLTGRWYGPTAPVAASDLAPVGTDRLSGTVTNRLPVPLVDAVVAFERHVYLLGTLAPGSTVRVELVPDRQLPGLLRDRSKTYLSGPDMASTTGRIDRANLALALMFHDSQSTAAGTERQLSNHALRYLDLTGLLALDRPMLVGRVDQAAARLVLGNAPTDPKTDQTTLVRVVLPLGKPQG